MQITDFLYIFKWWLDFFLIGIIFLPLTSYFLGNFKDKGYIFSKTIGIISLSYLIFIMGILRLFKFSQASVCAGVIILFLVNYIFFFIKRQNILSVIRGHLKIILLEEAIFFVGLLLWSYIRGFTPDIHGLEKFMDYGFINSILRSDYFPPKDIWYTPFSINYYYFGHFITAVLTKLSGIPSNITFNLMLASIFALIFSSGFSIGLNIIHFSSDKKNKMYNFAGIICGIFSAIFITLSGNLQTIYSFFNGYRPDSPVPFWNLSLSLFTFPNSYWYPNATRFIYHTIHEFPFYTLLVSDLHGHLLDTPVVLLGVAFMISLFVGFGKNQQQKLNLLFGGFILAAMYMTNAWDGLIYLLLFILILFYLFKKNKSFNSARFFSSIVILIFSLFLFAFPFNFFFKPFVSGIGIICPPDFLIKLGAIGPFVFEPNHCQRSPIWQLLILYGFFIFWIFSFLTYVLKRKKLNPMDPLMIILMLFSTCLIIVPEFIYLKDIYTTYFRANTMFKMVYQAFILLSIFSAYSLVKILFNIRRSKYKIAFLPYLFIAGTLICLVLIYPVFGINSFYNNLTVYHGLSGISYLQQEYPADYGGIEWLNTNIKGQPVILEAQGDSYTDFARVSVNTGLPTVLGWTVHEWLWRGSYEVVVPRITDVKTLYESNDLILTKKLIKKYNISYVFIGILEKQKYPSLNAIKFERLGKVVFQKGDTLIIKIRA